MQMMPNPYETPETERQRRRRAIANAASSQPSLGLPSVPPAPGAAALGSLGAPAVPAAPEHTPIEGFANTATGQTMRTAAGGAAIGGALGGPMGALAGGALGAAVQTWRQGRPSQQANGALANGWDGFSQPSLPTFDERRLAAQHPTPGVDVEGIVNERLTASPLGGVGNAPNMSVGAMFAQKPSQLQTGDYGQSPNAVGYNGGVSANMGDVQRAALPDGQKSITTGPQPMAQDNEFGGFLRKLFG